MKRIFILVMAVLVLLQGGNYMIIRTKMLTDAIYSPAPSVSGTAIRTQVNDSVGEVAALIEQDITVNKKLSPAGDFTGTINGGVPTLTEPGLSAAFNAHLLDITQLGLARYGIRHVNSTDTITRIGSSVGKISNISPSVNDFDSIMPWAGIRRCNLADNLNVNAYYGDASYTENGSNGQVMVEVPAFYYSRVQVDADTVETYISMLPLAGYKRHPWFYDASGFPVNKKYISAYEGSLYDVSALAYLLTDQQVADFTVTTGDKLSSIAGAKPCSGLTQNLTLSMSRILANNRGTGWQQQYFNAVSAIQMLFTVEYASLNSQVTIGQGVVNIADDALTNMSLITGGTSSLGNKSGRATGTDGLVSVSYRGIENFWGNIWKWVDGINIQNTNAFLCKINGSFVSDVFTGNYVQAMTLANVNGYMSKAGLNYNFDYGFLPAEVLGTSSSRYADYFYQNGVGAFVGMLGGTWANGALVGAFFWNANDGSTYRVRSIGARLCA